MLQHNLSIIRHSTDKEMRIKTITENQFLIKQSGQGHQASVWEIYSLIMKQDGQKKYFLQSCLCFIVHIVLS